MEKVISFSISLVCSFLFCIFLSFFPVGIFLFRILLVFHLQFFAFVPLLSFSIIRSVIYSSSFIVSCSFSRVRACLHLTGCYFLVCFFSLLYFPFVYCRFFLVRSLLVYLFVLFSLLYFFFLLYKGNLSCYKCFCLLKSDKRTNELTDKLTKMHDPDSRT